MIKTTLLNILVLAATLVICNEQKFENVVVMDCGEKGLIESFILNRRNEWDFGLYFEPFEIAYLCKDFGGYYKWAQSVVFGLRPQAIRIDRSSYRNVTKTGILPW